MQFYNSPPTDKRLKSVMQIGRTQTEQISTHRNVSGVCVRDLFFENVRILLIRAGADAPSKFDMT